MQTVDSNALAEEENQFKSNYIHGEHDGDLNLAVLDNVPKGLGYGKNYYAPQFMTESN